MKPETTGATVGQHVNDMYLYVYMFKRVYKVRRCISIAADQLKLWAHERGQPNGYIMWRS